tara:strand:+ start:123 stop:602 length:480 start_codon:yes stop_codon:yes gene_type:complete
MPQLDFSTFLPQIFWLFVSLTFLYIILSRYGLPRVSDVIEERKDIIAQDIDSAKKFSSETAIAIDELNLKLSEAKLVSQNLINDSFNEIREVSETKRTSLIDEVNHEVKEAEKEILEKKEAALIEISEISKGLAVEMLKGLSIGKIDEAEIEASSKKIN